MSVKFSEKEIRFLNYMRVGRLATGRRRYPFSAYLSRVRRNRLLHGHARKNP